MQQHILMVEDDEDLGQILHQFLEASSYKVDWIKSGEKVLPFLSSQSPDIILMDVQLPVISGIELTKAIRKTSDIPIIMVTSKTDEVSRLIGLETGVDDYVCKPFSAPELILRIKAILRRTSSVKDVKADSDIVFVDKNQLCVTYQEQAEKLTLLEANLLDLLLSSPHRIYSREQILDLAYNNDRHTSDRTIDSHIKNVRKKLEKIGLGKNVIESVYGVGYRYVKS
ncbi:response regulator [Thalassotalea agarivorans]|uniref:Two-component system, OmpR family, response regulator BaeR n=1 Tax=Thalassotalea agarivorans TaxID=349064 RepID=A0A1I0BHG3_THASX|nr:response regulator [Thalassotalea agarivorans]SET06401.1 two-component system, OmpR family, response regulator BaeR [Thalassotalea agarivorans]